MGLFTGPPRIPLFGSYLFLLMINFKYLHKAALTLSRWYKSDIIGLHVGPFPVAVVHSAEGVREILNNKAFDGRPGLYLAAMRDDGEDVRGEIKGDTYKLFWLDICSIGVNRKLIVTTGEQNIRYHLIRIQRALQFRLLRLKNT